MQGLKSKTFMLVFGMPPFGLQSWCFMNVHGTGVLFSRDASIESSPLLKTMFRWPEGHVLSLSKGDNGMNGVRNYTSPSGALFG